MAANLRDAYVQAVLRGWQTPALAVDYVPGVAITTAPWPDWLGGPWHKTFNYDSAFRYYATTSVNPDRPFYIHTEA